MEISFSLGRPDSLGLDEYHPRAMPSMESSETAIIGAMVPFARLTRAVVESIYLTESSIQHKLSNTRHLEEEMELWLQNSRAQIRPVFQDPGNQSRILKYPKWSQRQKLVVKMRHLNVMMVLYRSFLISAARYPREFRGPVLAAAARCVEAARRTITTMHETFCQHVFFRNWWYNTTYTQYAVSIILCYATRVAPLDERESLFALAVMTMEVLEAMDGSVVAKTWAQMIKQALHQAQEINTVTTQQPPAIEPAAYHNATEANLTVSDLADVSLLMMPFGEDFDFNQTNKHRFWKLEQSLVHGFRHSS
jgi:hypothetical protein